MDNSVRGYELAEKLYESRNSIIFRGYKPGINEQIVVKVLNKEYPSIEDIAKLKYEYTICSGFDSPFIVKVLGLENSYNGYAIIMECFNGASLRQIIEERGAITIDEFLDIAHCLLHGVAEIHQKNILHKDINPSNIMWNSKEKKLNIIDFGCSNILPHETPSLVSPNVLEGTLAYISPEQTGRVNRVVDYRTDYYSIGVTFYEMLTGEKPFKSEDPVKLVHSHIAVNPKSVYEVNQDVPKILSSIIAKLMSKNADDRYQSVEGILYDLNLFKEHFTKREFNVEFPLGRKDFSNKFEISQKLYGRDNDINELLQNFKDLRKGEESRITIISGFSGIGKTSLVREIYKPVTASRGYFISGKFEQFRNSTPYEPFVNAFQEFCKMILSENMQSLEEWKDRILRAVGGSGKVITDVIPQLEYIIGEQPPIPSLEPAKAQNRFNITFCKFVGAIASKEHPLVIFIDDLQWIDAASIKLMESILEDRDIKHLFFIGAYRDNEVSEGHPIILTLKNIQNKGKIVKLIQLEPMEKEDVGNLVCDLFKCNFEDAENLIDLCMNKTSGNPFFLIQFLKSLNEKRLVYYNGDSGRWEWDIEKIQNTGYTENVIDLVVDKINKIEKEKQNVLKIASCIGNTFTLGLLTTINQKSQNETANELWWAIEERFVLPMDENFKYFKQKEVNPNSKFKFIHDKVQQSAYSMIGESELETMHLSIGRLMRRNIDKVENIFDIVDHLNKGLRLVQDDNERYEIAELNLKAGKKARMSAAWGAAYKYLKKAVDIIRDKGWEKRYDFTKEIYMESLELAYLSSNFEDMDAYANVILKHKNNIEDELNVYQISMYMLVALDRRLEAINAALKALKLLGIILPEEPKPINIISGLLATKLRLAGKSVEQICNFPEMKDSLMIKAMNILNILLSSAFIAKPGLLPLVCFEMIKISVKYGNNRFTPFGYAVYAMVIFSLENIKGGLEMGDVYKRLFERYGNREDEAIYYFLLNHFIAFYDKHLSATLPETYKGYIIGIETGSIEYASWCLYLKNNFGLMMGFPLKELLEYTKMCGQTVAKYKQVTINNYTRLHHQAMLNLISSPEPGLLKGAVYDEELEEKGFIEKNNRTGLCVLYSVKGMLYFLFDDMEKAEKNISKANAVKDGMISTPTIYSLYFYDGLISLHKASKITGLQKQKAMKNAQKNLKMLYNRAKYGECNCLHKCYILEAEKCRVLNKHDLAIEYYSKAIKEVQKWDYANEEGLINELTGKYYLSQGMEKIAQNYFLDARNAYQRWGAREKVTALERTYHEVLGLKPSKADDAYLVESDLSSSIFVLNESLDMYSVIKASQFISGEIKYDSLIEKLLNIVSENVGAQRAVLILKHKDDFYIDSEYIAEKNETKLIGQKIEFLNSSMEQISNIPLSLINFVANSHEIQITNLSDEKSKFKNDKYFDIRKPKSVLCIPLLHQKKLKGMLYFENYMATDVFTIDRVNMVKMLTSQMVISIENSRIYNELEVKVEEKTDKLIAEIEQRKKVEQLLTDIATHDVLTGVGNRRLFGETLDAAIKNCPESEILAVLFIDLDGFKLVNDSWGHEKGDELLLEIAKRIVNVVKKKEMVFRIGGDEFVVILDRVKKLQEVVPVIENLIQAIARQVVVDNVKMGVTASIGASVMPFDGNQSGTLTTLADNAMYLVKRKGKNSYMFSENSAKQLENS